MNPKNFIYSKIRFDISHMSCQKTRKLMNYIRDYMNSQKFLINDSFNTLLIKEWGKFNSSIWAAKKISVLIMGKRYNNL